MLTIWPHDRVIPISLSVERYGETLSDLCVLTGAQIPS